MFSNFHSKNQFHSFFFPVSFLLFSFFLFKNVLFHFYPEFMLLIFHAFFSRLSFGDCFFSLLFIERRVVEVVSKKEQKETMVGGLLFLHLYVFHFPFYGVCMRLWRSDELTSLLLSFVCGEKLLYIFFIFHCIIISSNTKENSLLCNKFKHTIFV